MEVLALSLQVVVVFDVVCCLLYLHFEGSLLVYLSELRLVMVVTPKDIRNKH
jgi:hypothetical protein